VQELASSRSRPYGVTLCCGRSVEAAARIVSDQLERLGFRTHVEFGAEARKMLLAGRRTETATTPTIYVVCVQDKLDDSVLLPLRQALSVQSNRQEQFLVSVLDPDAPTALVTEVVGFAERLEAAADDPTTSQHAAAEPKPGDTVPEGGPPRSSSQRSDTGRYRVTRRRTPIPATASGSRSAWPVAPPIKTSVKPALINSSAKSSAVRGYLPTGVLSDLDDMEEDVDENAVTRIRRQHHELPLRTVSVAQSNPRWGATFDVGVMDDSGETPAEFDLPPGAGRPPMSRRSNTDRMPTAASESRRGRIVPIVSVAVALVLIPVAWFATSRRDSLMSSSSVASLVPSAESALPDEMAESARATAQANAVGPLAVEPLAVEPLNEVPLRGLVEADPLPAPRARRRKALEAEAQAPEPPPTNPEAPSAAAGPAIDTVLAAPPAFLADSPSTEGGAPHDAAPEARPTEPDDPLPARVVEDDVDQPSSDDTIVVESDEDATGTEVPIRAAFATPQTEQALANRTLWETPTLFVTPPRGGNTAWANARRQCADQEAAGLADWRLPTRHELKAIGRNGALRDGVFWSQSVDRFDAAFVYVYETATRGLALGHKREGLARIVCVHAKG